jgi:acyl transferase domain-containing protein/acyl carrier protein
MNTEGIAIIGMSGRFPKSKDVRSFWDNICMGKELITFFSEDELKEAGIKQELLDNPNYVKANGSLLEADLFDASFFGYTPLEAQIMDPQQRIFLECAWEALEDAGYDPDRYEGQIGVYCGADMNTYIFNILSNDELINNIGGLQLLISNDKDFLSTRTSYKLNLKGPSINVQTACSTSLVSVHLACQSLLNYECDMALAGGVNIKSNHKTGYLYQEGNIMSPDGHCRAFDAKAQGTAEGNGLGIVVLKKLDDALRDGDHIYAVIKGSAINNDGASKIGYTAPSVTGQAQVIHEASSIAGFNPETITYIECHGTATALGDPIEVEALKLAFGELGHKGEKHCAIGSVKTNVGHMSSAAGVTGLIKTALALNYKVIPPSLFFETPNPKMDFENSPFYVNTELQEWKTDGFPRRAGVSSFGIGGTNAHVVLEEMYQIENEENKSRPFHLLCFSAKTQNALEQMLRNFTEHLGKKPDIHLADAAYTLQVGRQNFKYKKTLVCKNVQEAIDKLVPGLSPKSGDYEYINGEITFMFPGQGSQYHGMGEELYLQEPFFKEQIDRCSEILLKNYNIGLIKALYDKSGEPSENINQAAVSQPAIFVFEYALAKLLIHWGIHPKAMIGHSIGEYVAACLAGVVSLKDAIHLVVSRSRLVQELPEGAMLAVSLPEAEVLQYLDENVSIAAVNGPSICIVSGDHPSILELENNLMKDWHGFKRIETSHAFHSGMLEPILDAYREIVSQVQFNKPTIPYVSNITGKFIQPEEVKNPDYWVNHLRKTVRFSEGINTLMKKDRIYLEVGPGNVLSSMIAMHENEKTFSMAINTTRNPKENISDIACLLEGLGKLWQNGVGIQWEIFHENESRKRVPLPTYPFERKRYWIDNIAKEDHVLIKANRDSILKKTDLNQWFYIPTWKHEPVLAKKENQAESESFCWLVFSKETSMASLIENGLIHNKRDTILVFMGEKFKKTGPQSYEINLYNRDEYALLLEHIKKSGKIITNVVHLWSITSLQKEPDLHASEFLYRDFYSILYLVQEFGNQNLLQNISVKMVTNHLFEIEKGDSIMPCKALLLGALRVIPQEYPNISCQCIDINSDEGEAGILNELFGKTKDPIVALRGSKRWVQVYENVGLSNEVSPKVFLREQGVYIITGGIGNIGMSIAKYLASTVQAKLILIGRTTLPEKEKWEELQNANSSDSISLKIKQIKELEELGAEVHYVSTDIANEEALQHEIDKIINIYGKINGLIHAAGVMHLKPIQELSHKDCEEYFEAKLYGLLALSNVLDHIKPDFCLLMSSISSVLGGLGYSAYSAANSFMDAYAEMASSKSKQRWISVNWDGWNYSNQETSDNLPGAELLELTMKPDEGIRVMECILSYENLHRVVISTGDLNERIDKWCKINPLENNVNLDLKKEFTKAQARPNIGVDYIEPRNEEEKIIAQIWSQMLGLDKVGIKDDFFLLGGQSLTAIQIIARIRQHFKVELPIKNMFENPTVENIAANVIEMKNKTNDQKEITGISSESLNSV